jgi:hypothetical protein
VSDYVPQVLGALADLALRRPWVLLALNLVAAAAAVVASLGAPAQLGIGSTRLEGEAGPELVIALEGDVAADTRVFEVAEDVITAQVEADPAVARVQAARQRNGAQERGSTLVVRFEDVSDDERQRAVERLDERIDPGPLRVTLGGETAALVEARRSLGSDLWRAELLVLPLVLLAMAAAAGPRLLLAPMLAAVTAVAGTLALMRLVGVAADVSLLGLAPGAVVGAVLGIELPAMVAAIHRDEATLSAGPEALRRTVAGGARRAGVIATAASLPALGLLATPLDQAPSLAFGCALGAWLAAASALTGTPALIAIRAGRGGTEATTVSGPDVEEEEGGGEGRVVEALRRLPGVIAAGRLRICAALAVAAVPLAALTVAAIDGSSQPLTADQFLSGTAPRSALGAAGSVAETAGSLFEELPLAAAIAAALLTLATLLVTRRPGALLVVPASLIGAAAGLGACVLVFQDGHLAELLDIVPRDALDTEAVATAACALAALGAARSAAALAASRAERRLGVGPEGTAELAAAFTLPGVAMATVAGVALTGALLGVDLYAAKEFGFAVAVGLLLDLLLVRVPLLAALARWGAREG